MNKSIPDGWCYSTLSALVDVDPESLKSSTDQTYQFKYIDIASVSTGKIEFPSETIQFSEAPSRARRKLKSGDVVMSTVRPNLKAFAYFERNSGEYVASTGFAVLRAKKGNSGRFIFNTILSDDISRQIEALVVGSNYPAINSSDVKNLEILKPTDTEQEKIACILTSVDKVMEYTEAQINKLKDLKAGMMQELLTNGIGHTVFKNSPLGRVPTNWKVTSLGDIADFFNGNSFKATNWTTHGLPIIRIQNLNLGSEFNYYTGEVNERWYVETGALLFAWAGQRGKSFGARIWNGSPGVLNQHIFKVVPNECIVEKDFLFLKLLQIQIDIERQAHGFKDSFMHVKKSDLTSFEVAIPTKDEQIKIIKIMQAIDAKLALSTKKYEGFHKIKSALMQDLLTGNVRVNVN